MRRTILFLISLSLATPAFAQQYRGSFKMNPNRPATVQTTRAQAGEASRSGGSLTGRVLGDGGQPLSNVSILVLPVNYTENIGGTIASILRPVKTGADGKFEIKDILPGSYHILPMVPGYVASGQSVYYRPGDNATISLVKGGVITGKVINTTGDPIVGLPVRAVRIKDGDNRPIRGEPKDPISQSMKGDERQIWTTDDRGIYRIYGLEPGVYLVAAGSKSSLQSSNTPYDGYAPTYHPSGTADTAVEVRVQAGQEALGVDIRFRESRGFTISGKLTEAITRSVTVHLVHPSTGQTENRAYVFPGSSARGFIFDPVEEGEYLIYAISDDEIIEGTILKSPMRRVTVKGANISGIDLRLAPLASVSGRVIVEKAPTADSATDCTSARPSSLFETTLSARSNRVPGSKDEPDWLLASYGVSIPNDKGEFNIRFVEAGLKRLVVDFSDESLYLKSISMPATAPNTKPKDLAKDGINIKSGDKVASVTVALSEGAASLSGRLSLPKDTSAPFSRMKVYLVPAEADASDSLLRYYEARIEGDGSFKLTSLAPGRYWILARPLMDEESAENAHRPKAWDAADRMGLRFEGEASATVLELKQCERIADYILKYTPPSKPDKQVKK